VSFAAIILYVASQRVIPKVSAYFVIDSVRKLLDTPSYIMSKFRYTWFHLNEIFSLRYVPHFCTVRLFEETYRSSV
jgi:hypothetical protein